jgi:hypothetical protein
MLMQHVPHRGRHAMRYFGLLSPRAKAQLWAGVFLLLNQQQRPRVLEMLGSRGVSVNEIGPVCFGTESPITRYALSDNQK